MVNNIITYKSQKHPAHLLLHFIWENAPLCNWSLFCF